MEGSRHLTASDNNRITSRARNLVEQVSGITNLDEGQVVTSPPPSPQADIVPQVVATDARLNPPQADTDFTDYNLNPVDPDAPAPQQAAPQEPQKPVIEDPNADYDPSDEMDSLIDPRLPAAQNFKNLRVKLKSVSKETKELKTQLLDYQQKVEQYESGIVQPEVVDRLHQRVGELEVYEKMFNFKNSPEYRESFEKPLTSKLSELETLAIESNVAPNDLTALLDNPNKAEVNRRLQNLLGDELTALEARKIINDIKGIERSAQDAEKQPEKTMESLRAKTIEAVEQRKLSQRQQMQTVSKDSWTESLIELRRENIHPEFTFIDNDPSHNEQFVKPLLTRAAQEYSKFVKALADSGAEYLSKDVSKALSKMTLLAHKSAILTMENIELREQLESFQKNTATHNAINRPSLNGGITPSSNSGGSNQSAAMRTISKVMGK